MKKIVGFILVAGLVVFNFFIDNCTNQDTDISFWSRLITILIICCTILVLIRKYRLNVPKEFRDLLNYKTDSPGAKRSLRILVGGTVISICIGVFIIAPLVSFSLIKINASSSHPCHPAKNKFIQTYQTGSGRSKKFYVDSYYDGRAITIRISLEMKEQIDENSQLPKFSRGRLGFYFIRE